MPSIINGLFAGRSGLSSHGNAIAVVGDNISNSSTPGYKANKALFEDIVSGGQSAGQLIGSGSATAAISSNFSQGTLEATGRPLDLAVDGNGFFVVNDNGTRLYTRAGNFKVDSQGFIVNQKDFQLLGFPAGGSGALQALSVNSVSQDSVNTDNVTISGNLDATGTPTVANLAAIPPTDPADGTGTSNVTEYEDLNNSAAFSTFVEVFDTLGASHTVTFYFFRDASTPNRYYGRAYVNSEEVDSPVVDVGIPRLLETAGGAADTFTLNFQNDGTLNTATSSGPQTYEIPWNNGSTTLATSTTWQDITVDLTNFTQYASGSNIQSIVQDGRGIGSITSVNIDKNGDIFALLDNGQSSVIGTVGLVNFAAPEQLTRVGGNLLQQSSDSGEPIVGRPQSGTFGAVQEGSIELSTVDIASEFVNIITLQRGFQANSRIITTVNQLLNEIIQLV